jgi:hypothetical protein
VRYIVQDDSSQLAAARRLISRCVAEGSTLFVPLTVVLELERVLRASFAFEKNDVLMTLSSLLSAAELTFESDPPHASMTASSNSSLLSLTSGIRIIRPRSLTGSGRQRGYVRHVYPDLPVECVVATSYRPWLKTPAIADRTSANAADRYTLFASS